MPHGWFPSRVLFSEMLRKRRESQPVQQVNLPRKMKLPLLIIVTLILSSLSYARNELWHDDVSLWEDAAKKSPARSRASYQAGLAYSHAGNDTLALSYLRTVKKANTSFFNLNLFRQTEKYLQLGQLKEALIEYKKLFPQPPSDAAIFNRFGNGYFEVGRLAEAEKSYQESIRLCPSFSEAHSNLGIIYQKMNLLDKATREFQIATRLAPRDPTPHAELGRHYAQMGSMGEAVSELRAALKLDPQHTNATRYLEQVTKYQESRKK